MGIRISKDHLHPSVIESITSLIGDLNQLETTAKGNAVEAINELLANGGNKEELEALIAEIAEGKELIANAVGEPLTAEESFDEMSNDINGLLSTFKTNMMNNGVTVESGDKFKALIDKIATLADSEGKGIQYASGIIPKNTQFKVETNFKPNIIMITKSDSIHIGWLYNEFISTDGYVYYIADGYNVSAIQTIDSDNGEYVNETGFCFDMHYGNEASYYAIGVGEEDTTLRDSLADILENKGVDVTEEDDMASLISKVEGMSSSAYNYNVKITCQEEEPTPTKFGDIWIPVPAGSYDISLIEGSETVNDPTNEDITIKIIDKYVKVTMDESINSFMSGVSNEFNINLNTNDFQTNLTTCLIPLLANSITQIFTKLGVVKVWNSTQNSWSIVNAKYWDGTKWVTFSVDDPILYRGMSNGKLIAYNLETQTELWSVSANMDIRSQIAIGSTNLGILTFGATTSGADITLSIRSRADGSLIYSQVIGGTSNSSSDSIMYCKDGSFIRHQYNGSFRPGFTIEKYNELTGEQIARSTIDSMYTSGYMGMLDNRIIIVDTGAYDEPVVVVDPGDLTILKSDQVLSLSYSNYSYNMCITKEGNFRIYTTNSSSKTIYYDDFKLDVTTNTFTKAKSGTINYTLSSSDTGVTRVFNMIHPSTLEELHVVETTVYDYDGLRFLIYNSSGTLIQTYSGDSYTYMHSLYYAGGNILVSKSTGSGYYYPESFMIYNLETNTLSSALFTNNSNYSYCAAISHGTIGYYNENYGL